MHALAAQTGMRILRLLELLQMVGSLLLSPLLLLMLLFVSHVHRGRSHVAAVRSSVTVGYISCCCIGVKVLLRTEILLMVQERVELPRLNLLLLPLIMKLM